MNEAQSEEDEQQDSRDLHQHHDVVGPRRLANAAHQDHRQQHDNKERRDVESRMPSSRIDVFALQVL
jgi:hypothetical protein